MCAGWAYKLWSSHLHGKSLTVDIFFKGIEELTNTTGAQVTFMFTIRTCGQDGSLICLVVPWQREKQKSKYVRKKLLHYFSDSYYTPITVRGANGQSYSKLTMTPRHTGYHHFSHIRKPTAVTEEWGPRPSV